MNLIKLEWRERKALERLSKQTSDATTLRRAQALLWLDRGECVADVAGRLGVSRQVIDHDPRLYDYNSTVWTAPLLTRYLADFAGLHVSIPSVRLALKRLRVKWKHPRYQLSLRPPTWQQAKGGLKRGSGSENEP